ncbi:hypothetical protein [Arsenicicoccus piscis]|uniref:[protein-PII] uridylyltransferase family protein n=1 Tax=Arsenicicoccus piscis TaxID=673954 RepID=UPI0024E04303|nr:hypothetical protein [Arsenicicoccus piscis]
MALAATGSLARGDSGPLSDLDLVLLHDGRQRAGELTALADRLWYPLWDSGLGLDHAVRSLGECRKAATADLTAAVGLLDLEHLCGDSEVVLGVRAALSHDWRANARKRLPELVESVQVRHERFGDVTQTLAPDLKEGAGGLRDMTVLRALTSAWLTDRPRGAVDEAHATLLDVRDGLQLVTGRGRSRLNVEDQDAVAALFGDQDSDDLLTRVCGAPGSSATPWRARCAARGSPSGRARCASAPVDRCSARWGTACTPTTARSSSADERCTGATRCSSCEPASSQHAPGCRSPRRPSPTSWSTRRRCRSRGPPRRATCSATCSPPVPA